MRVLGIIFVSVYLLGCVDVELSGGTGWFPAEDLSGNGLTAEMDLDTFVGTTSGELRVVTYNVHFGTNPAAFSSVLSTHPELSSADIYVIQEIETHADESVSRTKVIADSLQMNYVYVPWFYRPDKKDGGVFFSYGTALLSKLPLSNVQVMGLDRTRDIDDTLSPNYAISAEVDVNGTALRVVNVHLDLRLSVGTRIEQMHPIVESLDSSTNVVMGGDFNTNSFIWNEGIPITPTEVTLNLNHDDRFDEYMTAYGFDTPTKMSGPTQTSIAGDYRLDAWFTRGTTNSDFSVERNVDISDHYPLWLDVEL